MKLVNYLIVFSIFPLIAACATTEPVEPASERLGMAKSALEQARVSDADDLAPVLYQRAADKITRAEQAIRDGNAVAGQRLAHEASMEARLARLHADRATRQQLIDEIQAGIDALEEELAIPRN